MLVGDKTLPLLPVALEGAGRTVTKVKVYATAEAPGLAAAVAGLAGMEACAWGVLFSPSSSGYVLRHLEERGWRVRSAGGDSEDRREIRLVAIGETTAGFLRENGFRCDAVASTPDAPGVVEAICGADGRSLPVE
jgi:uroporphyrinogen-III synthase